MKRTVLPILFSLVSLVGFAQNDHLEPIGGYFDMYSHQYEYYANIRSILFKGMLDNPVLRYFVIPSFETEYVVQVDRGEANNINTTSMSEGLSKASGLQRISR